MAAADEASLSKQFADLHADSFGKLDVHRPPDLHPNEVDGANVQMDYARIYTFGGKMNDDEGKQFDLRRKRLPAGVSRRRRTPVTAAALSCK